LTSVRAWLLLFALVVLQLIGGIVHHLLFKKYQRRTIVTYVHLWTGRIIITLGIINGGLGLLLAGDSSKGQQIAYGVVGAVFWLAFVIVSVKYAVTYHQRSKNGSETTKKEIEGSA